MSLISIDYPTTFVLQMLLYSKMSHHKKRRIFMRPYCNRFS